MSLYNEIKFKDFITLQRGFDLPKRKRHPGKYPVIASTSINGYHNEYKVKGPGVVTGRSGSLGKVLFIKEHFWPLNTTLWVRDFKGNHPRFVYYFLQTRDLARYNSGVGVPTLNRNHLDNIITSIPDIEYQKAIAEILSQFDDLIEVNIKRIKFLENISNSIYTEWFVNLKFPGYENTEITETSHGLIPKGWNWKKVNDIIKRYPAGKEYRNKNVEAEGRIPVFDQSTNEYLGFHNNQPDHFASSENPMLIFGDHTCKMQIISEPFSLGPNVVPFKSKGEISNYHLFFSIKDLVQTQEYKRHWSELKIKQILVPEKLFSLEYETLVIPIFNQIKAIIKQNHVLKATRELLLPKLISGEIDVSNLDIGIGG